MNASNDSFDYFGITQEKESKHEEYGLATKVKLPEFLLSREQFLLLNEPQLRNFHLKNAEE